VLVFGPIDVNVVPGDTITWEYRSGSNQNFHRIRIGNNTATNGYKVIDVIGPAVVV
jgi:plastocyanin